jgi:hypothetical protein
MVHQRLYLQLTTNGVTLERIDYDSGTQPSGIDFVDNATHAKCLPASINPVIDEQNSVAGSDEISSNAKRQISIAIVRWRRTSDPLITVAGCRWVLSDFNEANSKADGDKRAEDKPSSFNADHHSWIVLAEQIRERGPYTVEQFRVPPPPGDFRVSVLIRAVAKPHER